MGLEAKAMADFPRNLDPFACDFLVTVHYDTGIGGMVAVPRSFCHQIGGADAGMRQFRF